MKKLTSKKERVAARKERDNRKTARNMKRNWSA